MNITKQIAWLLFSFFLLIYFLSAKGHIEVSDTRFSILTAQSLVNSGSFAIELPKDGETYAILKEGKYYSKYGLGLAFLLTPYVLSAQFISQLTGLPSGMAVDFFVSFYNVLPGALAVTVFFLMARFFGSETRAAIAASFFLGLGTMMWRYTAWDFSEATQMLLLFLSIYFIFKQKNYLCSLSLGGLILFKIVSVVYVPLFFLYLLFKPDKIEFTRRLKEMFKLSLFIAAGILLILCFNFIRFGSIFETGYGSEAKQFVFPGLERIGLVLFSLDKGLFIYNPILVFSIFGFFRLVKLFPKEACLLAGVALVNLLVTASWYAPGGGWCWGPRFLVPILPVLILPSLFIFPKNKFLKLLLFLFFLISFLVQLMSVLQKTHEYHHLRYGEVDQSQIHKMPPDIIGNFYVSKHKIFEKNNTYSLREFGIESDKKVDLSQYETFAGMNLWYFHLARHLKKPYLNFIPFIFLPFGAVLLIRLMRLGTSAVKSEPVSSDR